jgi:predicted amidohydrolase
MKKLTVAIAQGYFRTAFGVPTIEAIDNTCPRMATLGDEDFAFNRRLLSEMVKEAGKEGAQLVLSPECCIDGWSFNAGLMHKSAVEIPGPEADFLCNLAVEAGVWLCAGMFTRIDGKVRNSAVLVADDGRTAGIYHKTHETKDVLGQMGYELGDSLSVFDSPWSKIGILICHDRWYPTAAMTLAARGAELILNPSAGAVFHPGHKYNGMNTCMIRCQAYSNQLFWVNCNSAAFGGHSLIVGPDGSTIASGSGEQQVVVAELDPEKFSRYDFRSNLRGELYQLPG